MVSKDTQKFYDHCIIITWNPTRWMHTIIYNILRKTWLLLYLLATSLRHVMKSLYASPSNLRWFVPWSLNCGLKSACSLLIVNKGFSFLLNRFMKAGIFSATCESIWNSIENAFYALYSKQAGVSLWLCKQWAEKSQVPSGHFWHSLSMDVGGRS